MLRYMLELGSGPAEGQRGGKAVLRSASGDDAPIAGAGNGTRYLTLPQRAAQSCSTFAAAVAITARSPAPASST